jgi:hypothetical protein
MRGTSHTAAAADRDQLQQGHISLSLPTRYLSAAPHLRGGMLAAGTTGHGQLGARSRPIGRAYALNVLFGAEGEVPMSAVDIGEVKRQCRIALLQTMVRDMLTVAVVIASAVLEPLGTAIVFGLAIVIIIIAGRVRVKSGWTIVAIIAVGVVLFAGIYRRQVSFAIPLACLAICFIIFVADNMLSLYHLRKIRRISSPHPDSDGRGEGRGSQVNEKHESKDILKKISSKVYHDDYRFIGAGTPLKPIEFFVMLHKPLDVDQEIKEFSISKLLTHVGLHLLSQGVSGDRPTGRAYGPLENEGGELSFKTPVHFTEGFPYLTVMPVAAVHVPESGKHLVLRVKRLHLDYQDARAAADILAAADEFESQDDEEYYLRAITSSLDGQVVISIYINVALQGHALTMVMWPYILAPVVSDLRVADKLAAANPFILMFKTGAMTARQFRKAARRIHALRIRPRESGERDERAIGLCSIRERYAYMRPDNMKRSQRSNHIIKTMIEKITTVTEDYLLECNIDIMDYKHQYSSSVHSYTIFGDTAIFSGNFKDATATANMNRDEGSSSDTNNTR